MAMIESMIGAQVGDDELVEAGRSEMGNEIPDGGVRFELVDVDSMAMRKSGRFTARSKRGE
jgi:hypothetical protein